MTIPLYLKGLETARWYTRVVHMVLGMSRPTKHKKTGVYYLRKRVPLHLVEIVGASVVKRSLGTKDPAEAKIAHRAAETSLLELWAGLAKGAQYLDDEQVEALAGEIYNDELGRFGKVRSFAAANVHWWHVARNAEVVDGTAVPAPSEDRREYVLTFANVYIDRKLAAKNLAVDSDTRRRLQFAVHRALKQAATLYCRQMDGDWRPDPDAERFPGFKDPAAPVGPATKAAKSDAGLDVDDFWTMTSVGYSAGTLKRWRPILDRLVASAGIRDMVSITPSHVEAWRDHTLAGGSVSPRSFKRNDLAAIKTLFGVAVTLKELAKNPASEVTVGQARKAAARSMRGFHDEEAEKILQASLAPAPKRVSAHLAAARRWVPWICAYTGARVNEITQTRACDIKRVDGVWCIHITPEAGTQKSRLKRNVPLHEHLLAQGLVEFAKAKGGDRRLFAAEKDGGLTRAAEITGGKLATWVRSLGVKDLDVFPNHGWRHKFKTDARPLMQEMYIDAIQGHAPNTESRKYGAFPARQLVAEIAKMPRQKVEAPAVSAGPLRPATLHRKAKPPDRSKDLST